VEVLVMSARADFLCDTCGAIVEYELDHPEYQSQGVIACPGYTPEGDPCPGDMDRIWAAPHMGQMSSGEPPR
jgi:hypothetical protein